MDSAITVVIATYTNTGDFIRIMENLLLANYPIVVVDNLPTPEKEKLCTHKNVMYLPQKKNLGYANAINVATSYIKTEWIAMLNDDLIFDPISILADLKKYAIEHSLVAVAPLLTNQKGEIENAGFWVLPIGKVKLNFDTSIDLTSRTLDGITGACFLIKTEAFKQVGKFDTRFFAYLEDVDLCLRLKHAGLLFGIDPNIDVVHGHMATSSKMGNFKQKQDFKNWFLVIVNNWDKKTVLQNLPGIVLERLRNLSGLIKSFASK